MSATQKKKLCWNCEGRVSLEEENCPYCAVYLGPAPDEGVKQDVLAPPYRLVETEEEESQKAPASPYEMEEQLAQAVQDVPELEETKNDLKQVIFPVAFLSAGSLFLLFGLILLMFSDQGTLTLSWNAEYWYVYLVFALPALFLGWRALSRFEHEQESE